MHYIIKNIFGILFFNVILTTIPRAVRYFSENEVMEEISWATISGISLTDMFNRANEQGNVGNSLLIGASGVAYVMGQYLHDSEANLYNSTSNAAKMFATLSLKHGFKYLVIDSVKYTVGTSLMAPFCVGGAAAYSIHEYLSSKDINYTNLIYKAAQGCFNVASYEIFADYNPYVVAASLEGIDESFSSYMDDILSGIQGYKDALMDGVSEFGMQRYDRYDNYSNVCPLEGRFYSDFYDIEV